MNGGRDMIDWQAKRDTTGVQILLAQAREQGLDEASVLQGTQILPTQLEEPMALVANWQELQLLRNIQLQWPSISTLALANAMQYRPQRTGPLGQAMLACETLGEALTMARSYGWLGLSFSSLLTEVSAAGLEIETDSRWVPAECDLFCQIRGPAAILQTINDLLDRQGSDKVAAISLALKCDKDEVDADLEVFFGCAIQYKQPKNIMVLPLSIADASLPYANKKNRLINQNYCQLLSDRLQQEQSISSRLKIRMGSTPWALSFSDAACDLKTSERSLRRVLASEGVSFRQLVLARRMDMARQLLFSGERIATVAAAVAYSESASFSRAYKRHFGVSPSDRKDINKPLNSDVIGPVKRVVEEGLELCEKIDPT